MEKGGVSKEEMFNVFNMGIGFIVIVSPEDVYKAVDILKSNGEEVKIIGEISNGENVNLIW